MIKAEQEKLNKMKEELLSEIKQKDEIIEDLKKQIDVLKEEFNKKLEQAINSLPAERKGLDVVDVVKENRELSEEELKKLLKEQFFKDLNETKTI